MSQTIRAYGYVRVSVDEEGPNNASIAAQIRAIEEYAERNCIELVEIFSEPNVSGRKLARKQFDRMIALATSPERPVHQILVFSLSRFARRLLTQVVSEHKLAEAGVHLVSLTENFTQDATGRMIRSIVAIMNEKYAQDASIFTRRDRRGNARAGYWNGGPVPFGYRSQTVTMEGKKERKKLVIIEEEATVVRKIFDLASRGLNGQAMGTRSIAEYLNKNGYALRGRKFSHGNLDGILKREHYSGSYLDRTADDQGVKPSESDAILVPCPQIIDPGLIALVAARRAKAAPRVTAPRITNSPTLLTGIAICGAPNCGCGMTIRTGKGGQFRYYSCNARVSRTASACDTKAVRDDVLDPIVIETILERVLQHERLKVLAARVLEKSDAAHERREADLHRVRIARIEAEKRLRNLYELVESGLEKPSDRHFAQRLAERKREVAQLEASESSLLVQLNARSDMIDEAFVKRFSQALSDEIRNGAPGSRRAWVRLFVEQVSVTNDEITISGSKGALESALTSGAKRGTELVPSFDREWCGREDSNFHGLSPTTTSTLRVYQFRHDRT